MGLQTLKSFFSVKTGCILLGLAFLTPGCHFPHKMAPKKALIMPQVRRVVFIGFRPALSPGQASGVIRNPLTGSVFDAEPVQPEKADQLTVNLLGKLLKDKRWELVPPGKAMGVYSSLVSSDLALDEREINRRIGRAFSADALLIGYVYRWREREGTDFAVERPASVAFDLTLIGAERGNFLWRDRFDKTQASLSENLFDMGTFVKGGGKWMTAESLAEIGLEAMMKKMPKANEEQEE